MQMLVVMLGSMITTLAVVYYFGLQRRFETTPQGIQFSYAFFKPFADARGRGSFLNFFSITRRSTVSITLPHAVDAAFYRQGFLDDAAKKAEVSHEMETGDSHFDSMVYIASDTPRLKETLASKPLLRKAILDILYNYNVKRIVGDGKKLCAVGEVTLDPNTPHALPPFRHEIADCLHIIGQYLVSVPHDSSLPDYQLRAKICWYVTIAACLIGFFVLPFIMGFPGQYKLIDTTGLMVLSAATGIIVLLAFQSAFYAALMGSSRTHKLMIRTAAWMMLPFFTASFGLLEYANRHMDASEAVVLRSEVTGKYMTSSKSGWHYYLVLSSDDEQSVDKQIYDRIQEGKHFDEYTHPGYLGFRWRSRYKLPDA